MYFRRSADADRWRWRRRPAVGSSGASLGVQIRSSLPIGCLLIGATRDSMFVGPAFLDVRRVVGHFMGHASFRHALANYFAGVTYV